MILSRIAFGKRRLLTRREACGAKSERGATAIEYGLVLGFLAGGIFLVATYFSDDFKRAALNIAYELKLGSPAKP